MRREPEAMDFLQFDQQHRPGGKGKLTMKLKAPLPICPQSDRKGIAVGKAGKDGDPTADQC